MSFVESLRVESAERKERWDRFTAQMRQLQTDQERERQYIERLNPILMAHGLPPIDIVGKSAKSGRGFAKPGNRRTDNGMPPRRPEFAEMSLPDAVRVVLKDGAEMHASTMVPLVYDVSPSDKEAFHKASRSLVGTLADGARDGKWTRTKPNTFRLGAETNGHKNGKVAATN
jgi:hypothetical protein